MTAWWIVLTIVGVLLVLVLAAAVVAFLIVGGLGVAQIVGALVDDYRRARKGER